MFTGIVEATGEVAGIESGSDGTRIRIAATFASELDSGQSVSVDGACLTVEEHDDDAFEVFLATETLDRTTLEDRTVGDPVNVERALPADGRFDGHVVQGHVDATTTIREVRSVGEDWVYEFDLPDDQPKYVVEKGSIAIDGISLTVADVGEETFAVAIIPTTYEETTLSEKGAGDRVNVEIDVLAKYVAELVDR